LEHAAEHFFITVLVFFLFSKESQSHYELAFQVNLSHSDNLIGNLTSISMSFPSSAMHFSHMQLKAKEFEKLFQVWFCQLYSSVSLM
jgi:hypothetical protein